MSFSEECKRKDELLDRFWDLQELEREEMKAEQKCFPSARYDRMFKGIAVVDKIRPDSVRLIRENGKVIKALQINREIATLLKENDRMMLIAGRRRGLWRLISMQVIATQVESKPGEDPRFHMSAMNPMRAGIREGVH